MSDIDKLKGVLGAIQGHLQDLSGEQSANTRELGVLRQASRLQHESVKNLQARSLSMEASMTALGGTFASIEQLLTGLVGDRQTMETTVSDLVRRVEALEKKAS